MHSHALVAVLQSWVQDITTNQLHKFLAGTTAVRPLVSMLNLNLNWFAHALGSGAATRIGEGR